MSLEASELSKMLSETAHHHHQAFHSSGGVDPEWALWYAAHLQAMIWDSLGEIPTRSMLTHLLIAADKAQKAAEPDERDWHPFYANYILEGLAAAG